ncbi:unnamed protein product [Eruca vesicaria subsp. sativa]|uniref:Uncharacterized protein n=1 Tax=Eruca vesicaria subsp. sativa TaxID=29727 RepID=A0ABC8KR11_ERUVS|nr:unnamed protein product [Eruca vesicaria subsp. sativa]
MATALFNTTRISNRYHHHSILPPFSPRFHFRRQNISLLVTSRRLRRLAVVGGPPSPPSPDPPPPENTTQLEGVVGDVTKIEDRVKIFMAVLFWMSLFFWVTVVDGMGKGKGKKGSRFNFSHKVFCCNNKKGTDDETVSVELTAPSSWKKLIKKRGRTKSSVLKKDTEEVEKPEGGVEYSHVQEEDTEMNHPKEKENASAETEKDAKDNMVAEENTNPAPAQESGESMKDHVEDRGKERVESQTDKQEVQKKPVDAKTKTVKANVVEGTVVAEAAEQLLLA